MGRPRLGAKNRVGGILGGLRASQDWERRDCVEG